MPENSQESSQQRNPAEHLAPYQFQPGQSGNPGGRPKKKPVTEMFERILANQEDLASIEQEVKKIFTQKSGMAKVLLLEKMAERLEGKVTQPIEADVNINLSIADRMRRAKERLTGK